MIGQNIISLFFDKPFYHLYLDNLFSLVASFNI